MKIFTSFKACETENSPMEPTSSEPRSTWPQPISIYETRSSIASDMQRIIEQGTHGVCTQPTTTRILSQTRLRESRTHSAPWNLKITGHFTIGSSNRLKHRTDPGKSNSLV